MVTLWKSSTTPIAERCSPHYAICLLSYFITLIVKSSERNYDIKCYLFLFFKWCHIKFKPRNYWFFCWFLAATFVPIKGTPTRHLTSIQSFINLGKTFLIISKMKYHTALILGETLRYLLSFSRFWTFCIKQFAFLLLMVWQWKQRRPSFNVLSDYLMLHSIWWQIQLSEF